MFQLAKMVFYLLRELIFDNKEEYDFKSAKFNSRKFSLLILVTLSLITNAWLIYRFALLAVDYYDTREHLEQCVSEKSGKDCPSTRKKASSGSI